MCIWEESTTEQVFPKASAPTAPVKISSPSAAKLDWNPADFCTQIHRRMCQFSTRNPSCGRAWHVSTENWCPFSSEKFRDYFGQGTESEGGIAREWSRRLNLSGKWSRLFLVRRAISESAEAEWKHCSGSSRKMDVSWWFTPFWVWSRAHSTILGGTPHPHPHFDEQILKNLGGLEKGVQLPPSSGMNAGVSRNAGVGPGVPWHTFCMHQNLVATFRVMGVNLWMCLEWLMNHSPVNLDSE